MSEENYDHLAKILVIGESGVGKSSLIQRYIKKEFEETHLATIAIDFKMKLVKFKQMKIKL
jgi:GTPase SAR1 family protein